MEARITAPDFPSRVFDITKYGASPSGTSDSRDAIKAAIRAANLAGGGQVLVPPGSFKVEGPVHLKSNVELHVVGTLQFSSAPSDYLKEGLVLTRFEGVECFNYSPLIYAYAATNVAVTGSGTINGNGQAGFAKWRDKQGNDQQLIRHLGNDTQPSTAVTRVFGEGHFLRPSFIQFYSCKNVLVEGVTLLDSTFWVVHPVYSINVIVRGVTVNSPHINNDGIDPESCVDVLIENNNVTSGDDCVSIKSGRDADAWRVGAPCENIIIRNLTCWSDANAVCVGSEMSGGVRRVLVDGHVKVGSAENAVQFKANLDRGAFISDVLVRGIDADQVKSAVSFTNNYHGARGGDFPTLFSNVTLDDVHCTTAKGAAISIDGLEERPIANVSITNVVVDHATSIAKVSGTSNLKFENVTVNGHHVPTPRGV